MVDHPSKKNASAPENDRDLRLKKALRENLRRRKQAGPAGKGVAPSVKSGENGYLRRAAALEPGDRTRRTPDK
jgi:hypothetical protein